MPRGASGMPILGRSLSSRQLMGVMPRAVPVLKRQYSVIEETLCPAWKKLSSFGTIGSQDPSGLLIGTDCFLFYKKLRELAKQSELERQKVLEDKKRETKAWFETYFRELLKTPVGKEEDLEITKKDFLKLLHNKDEFAEHSFRLFDSDDSGDVSIQEIQAGLNKLSETGEANKKTIKWFVNRLEKFTNGDVTKEIFKKAINQTFLSKLFELMDFDSGGTVTLEEFKRSVDRLLMMGSDEKILAYLENMFHQHAKDPENITYEEFKKVIYNKQEYFTKKMFSICDKDRSNSISLQEFCESLGKLMKQSDNEDEMAKINKDKLHFLFRIYDDDDSGEIDRREMRECIEICTKESNLDLKDVQALADTLFDKADADKSGAISFDEFYNILKPFTNNLEINPKGWVLPEKPKKYSDKVKDFTDKYFSKNYLKNNIVLISNISVLILLYIIVFAVGVIYYSDTYPALMIAKGAGKCLNLTTTLLFVSMCRWVLTSIRNTPAGKFFALDSIVDIHKLLGYVYVTFALIHTAAHVFTFLVNVDKNRDIPDDKTSPVNYSFVLSAGGYFGGSYISGVFLDIVLCVMIPFAQSCVRRSGKFSQFYWVHFFSYWLLAIGVILHCQNAWKWIFLPLFVYAMEKIANMNFIKRTLYGKFRILNYKVLPSNVVELHISRPPTFNFHSGSYAFLTIPLITGYEKHPFTISSSSEDREKITFHIKMMRGWTKKLYEELATDQEYKKRREVKELEEKNGIAENGEAVLKLERSINERYLSRDSEKYAYLKNFGRLQKRDLECYIDGPYGTPATEIFESEHAVLVAAGIGVTPFASILQTIVDKYNQSGCFCSRCNHWNDHGTFNIKIKKLDFVWITRDQKSLQWFLELLKRLEEVMDRFNEHNPDHTAQPTIYDRKKSRTPAIKVIKDSSKKNGIELQELDVSVDKTEIGQNGNENGSTPKKVEKERFLDIHIYLTSALSKKDFRAVGLQYALQLMREGNPEGQDHITGLKAQTNTGRPDWDEVFDKIDDPEKHRKVTVFFCGSPVIEEVLKEQCNKRRYRFKAEKF
ncbi:NADPH oxidase 5-like isoform X8 [Bolinopsis microptera]|uniref:NADPH oxidase 5-like isoform X8 n=1 Tax=Bolinopsis microptera TaxID=2820187 RepID=UPI00307A9DF0